MKTCNQIISPTQCSVANSTAANADLTFAIIAITLTVILTVVWTIYAYRTGLLNEGEF